MRIKNISYNLKYKILQNRAYLFLMSGKESYKMRCVFRKIMALILICVLLVTTCTNVLAKEVSTEAVYNLQLGGMQTFIIRDYDGEIAEVVIEEMENKSRVANGNYKVTYKNTGAWEAGFYVEISSNQIVSVYSPFYSVATGSISQATLVRNSTVKATLSFIYKLAIMSYSCRVVAEIEGTNLVVSKK